MLLEAGWFSPEVWRQLQGRVAARYGVLLRGAPVQAIPMNTDAPSQSVSSPAPVTPAAAAPQLPLAQQIAAMAMLAQQTAAMNIAPGTAQAGTLGMQQPGSTAPAALPPPVSSAAAPAPEEAPSSQPPKSAEPAQPGMPPAAGEPGETLMEASGDEFEIYDEEDQEPDDGVDEQSGED